MTASARTVARICSETYGANNRAAIEATHQGTPWRFIENEGENTTDQAWRGHHGKGTRH